MANGKSTPAVLLERDECSSGLTAEVIAAGMKGMVNNRAKLAAAQLSPVTHRFTGHPAPGVVAKAQKKVQQTLGNSARLTSRNDGAKHCIVTLSFTR